MRILYSPIPSLQDPSSHPLWHPGSGHVTGIDQSLEAGPGCKVGHHQLGQQHFWSKEEIASWLLSIAPNAHHLAQGLARGTHSVLFVELKA